MIAFLEDAQFYNLLQKSYLSNNTEFGGGGTSKRKCSEKITQLKLTCSDYSPTFQKKRKAGNVIHFPPGPGDNVVPGSQKITKVLVSLTQ